MLKKMAIGVLGALMLAGCGKAAPSTPAVTTEGTTQVIETGAETTAKAEADAQAESAERDVQATSAEADAQAASAEADAQATSAEADPQGADTDRLPKLSPAAETITAYGQILNNACVYINENHKQQLTGDLLTLYEETAERLHRINLKGIDAYGAMELSEREQVLLQLEDIETVLFEQVAEGINIKAELTEAVTTTADKKADIKKAAQPITVEETTVERITAG